MSTSYVPPGGAGGGAVTGAAPDLLNDSTHHHTNAPVGSFEATHDAPPVVVIGGPQQEQDGYVNMEAGSWKNDDNVEQQEDDNQSIISSVMTADGIHDVTGFSIVCFVILVGDMARGVMFPTLWPLVALLGGTTVTLGFAVASFSLGRIIVSPLFGSWSVIYGYKKVLFMSLSILMGGTLVYAQAQNVGSPAFLIFAQLLLGVGSGTLGVTRAFVAEVTATRTRTRYMAWITAVQYAGFTVTPFFGSLFIKLLGDNDYQWGYVTSVVCCFVNATLSEYVLCLMSLSHTILRTFQSISIEYVYGSCLFHDHHRCHYLGDARDMVSGSTETQDTKGQEKVETPFCD